MSQFDESGGRRRVVVDRITPALDAGRFAIKRTVGDQVEVLADIFCDGHDEVRSLLLWRPTGELAWRPLELRPLGNDAWNAHLSLVDVGRFEYTCEAWADGFRSWHRDLKKRVEAGQDVRVDLEIGAQFVDGAARRAAAAVSNRNFDYGPLVTRLTEPWKPAQLTFAIQLPDGAKAPDVLAAAQALQLAEWAKVLRSAADAAVRVVGPAGEELAALMDAWPDRSLATRSEPLPLVVDRERARFSAWYEFFPRSTSAVAGQHGTFRDCIARLPYVAEMGFDILYLPPIHPIGMAFRKGKNNALVIQPGEPGSPWAIGSPEGGHKAIHRELGTLDDFRDLIAQARALGIDVALDIAFQCSPDHPYVQQHPDWFRARPDGTIQYAENPPKKYQDIYPFDFETRDWRALWEELRSVFAYWCSQGVRVFRVDNPHTKPFPFWEWTIGEIKRDWPETMFLSEAFTRPKIMYRLGKLGFSQSYTYFTWRNGRQEFVDYFTELTKPPVVDFFRPNLWPNTPDILPEHLQRGGRPAFTARVVLAATLGASYGIYGPAYELGEHLPLKPGSEEYLDSEKYEIRHWDLNRADSLRGFITQVNRIRRDNVALHDNRSLQFHNAANDQLLCYSKRDESSGNLIVVVVNLDFYTTQRGFVDLPLEALGLAGDRPYEMWDLLSDARFTWRGPRNYVELDPQRWPAHVFSVRRL
jgi:starch synthase (maltosyl-transferring)